MRARANSRGFFVAWLSLAALLVASCATIQAPGGASSKPGKKDWADAYVYLKSLNINKLYIERMTACVPFGDGVPPIPQEWLDLDSGELYLAEGQLMERLVSCEPGERLALQCAVVLIMQEELLQQVVASAGDSAAHAKSLEKLRRFRRVHPEVPGVICDQVLEAFAEGK